MPQDEEVVARAMSIKLKATSILTQIADMERKYMAGDPNMQPHLIDVRVYEGKYLQFGYTLQPHLASSGDALCGYDIKRNRYMVLRWVDLLQISMNSLGYEPVDNQAWERRIMTTNLLVSDENIIHQSKGIFTKRNRSK